MQHNIRETLAELYDGELLLLDPPEMYDSCIVGVAHRCGMEPVAVYNSTAVIAALQASGMSEDDANEWFDFNIVGSYVGGRTPLFMTKIEEVV